MTPFNPSPIRHTVVFRLKHPKASEQERTFLAAVKQLAFIPGVEKFECLEQVSPKNQFTLGLSMEFADQSLYDQYNAHPAHTAFLEQHWFNEVEDFLEIDYKLLSD